MGFSGSLPGAQLQQPWHPLLPGGNKLTFLREHGGRLPETLLLQAGRLTAPAAVGG